MHPIYESYNSMVVPRSDGVVDEGEMGRLRESGRGRQVICGQPT